MEDKILGWLHKQGFPLEMRAAQKFAVGQFRVTQSAYYSDFESGDSREIDLLCRLYGFCEPAKATAISELELFCAVECKSSANPWVVFRQTKASSWTVDSAVASRTGSRLVHSVDKSLSGALLTATAERAGHGVREAFAEGDRAFAAMMSALKASEAVVRDGDRRYNDSLGGETDDVVRAYSALALPIVVLASPLFECTLNESGAPELHAVERSSVVLRYPRSREGVREGAVIYLIREHALPEFIDGVLEYFEVLKAGLGAVLPVEP